MAINGYTQKLTTAEKKLQVQLLNQLLIKHKADFLLSRMIKGPKRIYVGVLALYGLLIEAFQCRAKNQNNKNVENIAFTHKTNGYDKENLFPLAITNGIWFLWYDGKNRRLYYEQQNMVECNTTFVTINYDGSVEDFMVEFDTELDDLGDACNPVVNASAPTSNEDITHHVIKQFKKNIKEDYSSTKAFVKENDSAEIIAELKLASQQVAERKQQHNCWYKNKRETTKWINNTPAIIFNNEDIFKGARSVVNNSTQYNEQKIFIPLQTDGKFAKLDDSKYYTFDFESSVQNSFHNTQVFALGKSDVLVNVEGTSSEQVERDSRLFYVSRLINILRNITIWFNVIVGIDSYINASATDKLKDRTQALDKILADNKASLFVANLDKELSANKKYVTMKQRCGSQFIEKADALAFEVFLSKETTLDYDFGADVRRIKKDSLYKNVMRKVQ